MHDSSTDVRHNQPWRHPIFVRSDLDDMGLSMRAFRVYGHLVRRAGKDGDAFPSYQSIGDKCFCADFGNPRVRRRHAIEAVKELEAAGLVAKQGRPRKANPKEQDTNLYILLEVPQALHSTHLGTVEYPPRHSTVPTLGTVEYPEGSPSEGSQVKEKEEAASPVGSFSPEAEAEPKRAGQTDSVVQAEMNRHEVPQKPQQSGQTGSPVQAKDDGAAAIVEAYLSALEKFEGAPVLTASDRRQMNEIARAIAQAGYTPRQVAATVAKLKADKFWAGRHLSLATVGGNIGAVTMTARGLTAASSTRQRAKNLMLEGEPAEAKRLTGMRAVRDLSLEP